MGEDASADGGAGLYDYSSTFDLGNKPRSLKAYRTLGGAYPVQHHRLSRTGSYDAAAFCHASLSWSR